MGFEGNYLTLNIRNFQKNSFAFKEKRKKYVKIIVVDWLNVG